MIVGPEQAARDTLDILKEALADPGAFWHYYGGGYERVEDQIPRSFNPASQLELAVSHGIQWNFIGWLETNEPKRVYLSSSNL
jgi:hypothetical protein